MVIALGCEYHFKLLLFVRNALSITFPRNLKSMIGSVEMIETIEGGTGKTVLAFATNDPVCSVFVRFFPLLNVAGPRAIF